MTKHDNSEAAAHRRGELHAQLCDLIELHGLEDVIDMLRTAAEDHGFEVGLDPVEVIRFPKKCGCGRWYQTRGAWMKLPALGPSDDGLEYRNCPCGSTLCVHMEDT